MSVGGFVSGDGLAGAAGGVGRGGWRGRRFFVGLFGVLFSPVLFFGVGLIVFAVLRLAAFGVFVVLACFIVLAFSGGGRGGDV